MKIHEEEEQNVSLLMCYSLQLQNLVMTVV